MQKELFQKLAESLANKYTQQELAEKLVQRKDKRVSNLIASAYNKKIMSTNSKPITQEFDFYEYKHRTTGPNSWFYKYLSEESWKKFMNKLNTAEDAIHKEYIIAKEYYSWKIEIEKQKSNDIRRILSEDKKLK